jgi:hypothetical protein
MGNPTLARKPSGRSIRHLRTNGLILRVPGTTHYRLTGDGLRFAIFYTKSTTGCYTPYWPPTGHPRHRRYEMPCTLSIFTSSKPSTALASTKRSLKTQDNSQSSAGVGSLGAARRSFGTPIRVAAPAPPAPGTNAPRLGPCGARAVSGTAGQVPKSRPLASQLTWQRAPGGIFPSRVCATHGRNSLVGDLVRACLQRVSQPAVEVGKYASVACGGQECAEHVVEVEPFVVGGAVVFV